MATSSRYILKLKKTKKKITDWCFYLFLKLSSCMKCDKTFQTQADAAGCAPRSNFAFADDAYFSFSA